MIVDATSRATWGEEVGLLAFRQVGLSVLLSRLGFSASLRYEVAGAILGCVAHPTSDRETHRWLREDSVIGEDSPDARNPKLFVWLRNTAAH